MSNGGPYREPGVPMGILIHEQLRCFVSKEEWDEIQAAMTQDGYRPDADSEWTRQVILKALRERRS